MPGKKAWCAPYYSALLRRATRRNRKERLPHRFVVRRIGEVDTRQVKRCDRDILPIKNCHIAPLDIPQLPDIRFVIAVGIDIL